MAGWLAGWLAGRMAGWLLAGWLLAAGWLLTPQVEAPQSGEAKKYDPWGHTTYNNRLLEAVKYDTYKMRAYKPQKNCKMTCRKL